MRQPNPEIIKRAIEDVQKVYDELHTQLLAKLAEAEQLKASLLKLEIFLGSAKKLLVHEGVSDAKAGEVPFPAASLKPSSHIGYVPPLPLIEKPLLEGGIEILKEAGHPMHLNEIVEEFRKRRWKLSEKNGREVLRFTFKKHIGTIFTKNKKGQYGLINPDQRWTRPPKIRITESISKAITKTLSEAGPPKEQ